MCSHSRIGLYDSYSIRDSRFSFRDSNHSRVAWLLYELGLQFELKTYPRINGKKAVSLDESAEHRAQPKSDSGSALSFRARA